jgi:hypothetical protein
MTNNGDNATALTAFSPPGALALIWSHSPVSLQAGLAGQILLMLLACVLLLLSRRNRRVN